MSNVTISAMCPTIWYSEDAWFSRSLKATSTASVSKSTFSDGHGTSCRSFARME